MKENITKYIIKSHGHCRMILYVPKYYAINSLVPLKCGHDLKSIIAEHMLQMRFMSTSSKIDLGDSCTVEFWEWISHLFHPTLCDRCDYSAALRLRLNHISKSAPRYLFGRIQKHKTFGILAKKGSFKNKDCNFKNKIRNLEILMSYLGL